MKKLPVAENDFHNESNKIFEDDELLVVQPYSEQAICYFGGVNWCNKIRLGYKEKIYFFISKNKDFPKYAILKRGEKSFFYDSENEKISTEKFLKRFPQLEDLVKEIVGFQPAYSVLMDFVDEKIAGSELESNIPEIQGFRYKSPIGDSVVSIELEWDEFEELLGLSEEDRYFMNDIFNPYSDYKFEDEYTMLDNFLDGIFGGFHILNEDNLDKLKKISQLLLPSEKFNLSSDDFMRKLGNKMNTVFPDETRQIVDEFTWRTNDQMNQTAEDTVQNDIEIFLKPLGFTYKNKNYPTLYTTVGSLIWNIMRYKKTKSPLKEVLKTIFEDTDKSLGGWYDNTYTFEDSESFNTEGYNRDIEKPLEKMLEKLEEDTPEFKEFITLSSEIINKWGINTFNKLPKKPNTTFKIIELDPQKMRVLVRVYDHNNSNVGSRWVKMKDFNLFLHQPELEFGNTN